MKWLRCAPFLFLLLMAPLPLAAESEEGPQSRVATAAIERYEQDLERAAAVYEQAVSRAEAQLQRALKTARRLAEQRGDEDEVRAIEAMLGGGSEGASRRTVVESVLAGKPWQKVAEVGRGDRLDISATGRWSLGQQRGIGPNGQPDIEGRLGLAKWALIARVGDGDPFLVGESTRVDTDRDGPLLMMVNEHPDRLGSASGTLRIVMKITPGDAPAVGSTGEPVSWDQRLQADSAVSANLQWTDVLKVRKGEKLVFRARGRWRCGSVNCDADGSGFQYGGMQPAGAGAPLPGSPLGSLIGRIDDGEPFFVGTRQTVMAPDAGMLRVGINDRNPSDNSGQIAVSVKTFVPGKGSAKDDKDE